MLKQNDISKNLDVDVRFLLANERTLLAWIRTALTLIAGGVAVAFISTDSLYGTVAGMSAVVLGAVFALTGYVRYHNADNAIRAGRLPATGLSGILLVSMVVLLAAGLVLMRELHIL